MYSLIYALCFSFGLKSEKVYEPLSISYTAKEMHALPIKTWWHPDATITSVASGNRVSGRVS